MQTLYIDVYFLINFTVDYLALYFSLMILHISTRTLRLVIASGVLSLLACLVVLSSLNAFIYIIILILGALMAALIAPIKVEFVGVCRLLVAFLVFETVFGGAVSSLYTFLDKVLGPYLDGVSIGAQNSRLLLILAIILMSYGLIKLAIAVLGRASSGKVCHLRFRISEININTDGLVDSGNLLTDPIYQRPVILVKRHALSALFSAYGEGALCEVSSPLYTRIVLLPMKSIGGSRILYGVRPDEVEIIIDKKSSLVNAVVAIDDTDGKFDTQDALVPASLLI